MLWMMDTMWGGEANGNPVQSHQHGEALVHRSHRGFRVPAEYEYEYDNEEKKSALISPLILIIRQS
jgi:hypothetical protein